MVFCVGRDLLRTALSVKHPYQMAINKNEKEENPEIFGNFILYFRRDRIRFHNRIVAELVKKHPPRTNVKYGYAERII